jgi:hypothetical protein
MSASRLGKLIRYLSVLLVGALMGGTASAASTSTGRTSTPAPTRTVGGYSYALHEVCDASGTCAIGDTADIVVTIPVAMSRADVAITYSFSYVTSPAGDARLYLKDLCESGNDTVRPRKFFLAHTTKATATSVTWAVVNIKAQDQSCLFSPELRLLDQHQPGRAATLGGTLVIEVSPHEA